MLNVNDIYQGFVASYVFELSLQINQIRANKFGYLLIVGIKR